VPRLHEMKYSVG